MAHHSHPATALSASVFQRLAVVAVLLLSIYGLVLWANS